MCVLLSVEPNGAAKAKWVHLIKLPAHANLLRSRGLQRHFPLADAMNLCAYITMGIAVIKGSDIGRKQKTA